MKKQYVTTMESTNGKKIVLFKIREQDYFGNWTEEKFDISPLVTRYIHHHDIDDAEYEKIFGSCRESGIYPSPDLDTMLYEMETISDYMITKNHVAEGLASIEKHAEELILAGGG